MTFADKLQKLRKAKRLSFFYAYEQKGATTHDKAKREKPRGAASRD